MSEHIHHVTDGNFDSEVLQSQTPCPGRLLGRVVRPAR